MARPFLRGVVLQITEATLASSSSAAARLTAASSLGSTSAPAYVFEVYASETVLAALRASTASAARRAGFLRVACSTDKGVTDLPLFVLEEPSLASVSAAADRADSHLTASSPSSASASLPSASAAADRADSSRRNEPVLRVREPPLRRRGRLRRLVDDGAESVCPSASLFVALHATEWIRASLGTSPAVAAARDESSFLTTPTPAAAARGESFFHPATPASSVFYFPIPADAGPRPFADSRRSLFRLVSSSSTSVPRSLTRGYSNTAETGMPPSALDIDQLISDMNKIELNSEDARRFRIAFHKKNFPYWGASDVGDYLQYQVYNNEGWRYLLKIVYRRAGPHVEAMLIQIREDLESSDSREDMDPDLRRLEVKFDMFSKKLDNVSNDVSTLLSNSRKKKMEWGTLEVFGRKFDVSKVIAFVTSLWF